MADNAAPGFAKHPGYALAIAAADGRVQAVFNGEIIADSTNALAMTETKHDPIFYFPRADVRMDRLTRTGHDTFCPFKGHASYWTIADAENTAWSYETPYDEVPEIKDYIAFYGDKVTVGRV